MQFLRGRKRPRDAADVSGASTDPPSLPTVEEESLQLPAARSTTAANNGSILPVVARQTSNAVSSNTSTSVSLSKAGGGGKKSNSTRTTNPQHISKSLWIIRLAFLVSLAAVAFGLSFLSYTLVSKSEHNVGLQQFETLAVRALSHVQELRLRRRENMKSMAQIAATAFPNASLWPIGVAIPAFERVAADLIRTSDNVEMAFYPLIENKNGTEQKEWEQFALDFLHREHGLQSFGRGIWQRGDWKSNATTAMFPELQNSRKGLSATAYLMLDIHAEPVTGQAIDKCLECSQRRAASENRETDCGVVTNITHWNRASFLVQPIYPLQDPFQLTGVIVSMFSWDRIMEKVFTEVATATGVHVVLTSENKSYTYLADHNTTTFLGQSDYHDPGMTDYAKKTTLSSFSGIIQYELIIYPTTNFFSVYTTKSPVIALVSAIVAVVFTTFLFLVYDLFVRREFVARHNLLQAKRQFMRFVSHEVRTPLNSVIMGLTIVREEVAALLSRRQQQQSSNTSGISPETADMDVCLQEWQTLLGDVYSSAQNSVDVLNDLLNYDKIETVRFVVIVSSRSGVLH